MAEIPRTLLRHRVDVEPRLGTSPRGDVYGDPVTVRCLVEERRRQVRADDGAELVAEATLRARLADAAVLGVGARVTLPTGRTTWVLDVRRHDDAALGAWQHCEVMLA